MKIRERKKERKKERKRNRERANKKDWGRMKAR